MDLVKELLIVTGRILTILPLMLLVALYMGKRSIGELPVFDFLVIIILGAVVGAHIADPAVPHIHTAGSAIEDLNINKADSSLSYSVIIEGIVYSKVLTKLNLTEEWLNQQLASIGVKSAEEIFFASVNTKNQFQASLKSFLEGSDEILRPMPISIKKPAIILPIGDTGDISP